MLQKLAKSIQKTGTLCPNQKLPKLRETELF
jgi:hypothetical protein